MEVEHYVMIMLNGFRILKAIIYPITVLVQLEILA